MTDYAAVLTRNYPDATWTLNGSDYSALVWLSEMPKPTQSELDAAWASVQAGLANERIQQRRAAAYRSEADPLFFYWQAGEGTEQAWLDKRAEIRDRFPYVDQV